ncbi:MAG: ribonuclease P protein component, partial [Candidatus Paceibacteria bacterium]
KHLILIVVPASTSYSRVGIVIKSKIERKPQRRNYFKRRLREAARALINSFRENVDMIIMLRKSPPKNTKTQDFIYEIKDVLKKSDIL